MADVSTCMYTFLQLIEYLLACLCVHRDSGKFSPEHCSLKSSNSTMKTVDCKLSASGTSA